MTPMLTRTASPQREQLVLTIHPATWISASVKASSGDGGRRITSGLLVLTPNQYARQGP